MSTFYRRLLLGLAVVIGLGTGLAQAQTQYTPQTTSTTPAATTPAPTTVLPTTTIKVLPTPQERADKLAKTVGSAFNGITRKNLIKGTKISLAVNGGGSAIVQLEVAKKGSKKYQQVGKLKINADGSTKKTTLKIGKTGVKRLNAAASKGKKFKLKLVVAIYSDRGTAKASSTINVKG